MATTLSESGLEEGEYDSDSDGTSALALRRRQASDDEDRELPLDAVSSADDDEDEEDEDDASPHSFSDEEGEDGEGTPLDGEDEAGASLPRRRRLVSDEEDDHEGLHQEDISRKSIDPEGSPQGFAAADVEGVEGADPEKKEAEPFVVPTAGAFYMHDDRFRGATGNRPRRGVGGSRKLWEAKDEKPWVHDLFEELNLRDDSFRDDGFLRGGRGRCRGRGRINGDRHRGWAGKLASDSEDSNINRVRRGRGKGRPAKSEGGDHGRVDQESGSSAIEGTQESTVSTKSEGQDDNTKHEFTAPRRVGAGSLNSASPPFFPSSALQQKIADGSESTQGNVIRSTKGRDRGTKSGSQVFVAKSGGSGRLTQVGGTSQGSIQSQEPVVPPSTQTTSSIARSSSSSSQGQSLFVPSTQPQSQQQEAHGPSAIAQVLAGATSANLGQSVQPGRPRSTGGRGCRAGHNHVVGGRGGPFVYHGGASTGINNVQKLEPGFSPPIPAVGPVAVQYGGHPPAGIPLPAVGMAMANYSGQPQYGFHNSEVTWIPVLAGGGTIGAGYATPYMTMDGTPSPMYFSQPAPQPPSFRPTGNSSKPSGLWKPPPNQDLGPGEFGHRQSKPRRYSEMNFGQ